MIATKKQGKTITSRRLGDPAMLGRLIAATACSLSLSLGSAGPPSLAGATPPPVTQVPRQPVELSDPNQRVQYLEDGPLSKELHLPLYEWYPKDKEPNGVVVAIHGLTLHGKRYEVLGRAFAAEGFYACAFDMRGFGRCYTDSEHKFAGKQKTDPEKSYLDLVALTTRLRQKFPKTAIFVMGESLGTTYCIKLAAEHHELVDGLLLSGPTVQVNPLMFLHPSNMAAGPGPSSSVRSSI